MPRPLDSLIKTSKHEKGVRGATSFNGPKYENGRNCDNCGGVNTVINTTKWRGTLCTTCGHKTFADEKAREKHDKQLFNKGGR